MFNFDSYSQEPSLDPSKIIFKIDIPLCLVGWVIGREGVRLLDLKVKSNCKIWLDQKYPDDKPRKLIIEGSPSDVRYAHVLVRELLNSAPIAQSSLSGNLKPENIVASVKECPANLIGLIYGKNGETLKSICFESGANVTVHDDQTSAVKRLIIYGIVKAVTRASSRIDRILNSVMEKSQEESASPEDSGVHSGAEGETVASQEPVKVPDNPGKSPEKVTTDSCLPEEHSRPAQVHNRNINTVPYIPRGVDYADPEYVDPQYADPRMYHGYQHATASQQPSGYHIDYARPPQRGYVGYPSPQVNYGVGYYPSHYHSPVYYPPDYDYRNDYIQQQYYGPMHRQQYQQYANHVSQRPPRVRVNPPMNMPHGHSGSRDVAPPIRPNKTLNALQSDRVSGSMYSDAKTIEELVLQPPGYEDVEIRRRVVPLSDRGNVFDEFVILELEGDPLGIRQYPRPDIPANSHLLEEKYESARFSEREQMRFGERVGVNIGQLPPMRLLDEELSKASEETMDFFFDYDDACIDVELY